MIVLSLMLIVGIAWIDAYTDAWRWKRGEKIYHIPEGIVRLLAIWFIGMWRLDVLVLNCAIFWILFELILYAYRGLPWDYVGKTDIGDKLWRKLFPNNTGKWLMALKILSLIIGILIYIKWEQILKFIETVLPL